jgi:hypothetical protein
VKSTKDFAAFNNCESIRLEKSNAGKVVVKVLREGLK